MEKNKLRILVLCTGNSCRSQMAEFYFNQLRGDFFEASSAGVAASSLNPYAVEVMKEDGIDMSGGKSEQVDRYLGEKFDIVLTVCGHADETCPVFPGKVKRIHHGFDDPPKLTENFTDPEKRLAVYRRVRDEIKDFVLNFTI